MASTNRTLEACFIPKYHFNLLMEIDAKFYPIEIKAKSNLTKHDARGILAFRESYPKANIQKGLILYTGKEAYSINDEVLALPWRALVESD